MSDEQTEQERDAAVIAKSAQRHADLRALATLRCVHIEETALLVRVANAGADLIQAQHRDRVRLTAERNAARAEVERLRDILSRLLDAFGTPATRETETNLSEAMTAFEAANMKDEAHVLRTTIEAIRAALGTEADHDSD